ncbi:MAG: hypothetical protein ACD_49C00064G0030 [uncultured bacterium (gcode 4)]|uniref:ATPase dynein-related AAA domain-containing protein n=1 Tax=uncultured bacterium (gcode 4) TaxID=1234023 RepID=K2AWH6_9BACT|nr:MAG: hypothetical protein ACD_49C00064G0030 [uncultured bacterium (gcode 4)]
MLETMSLQQKLKSISSIREQLDLNIKWYSDVKEYILKSFLNGEHILLEWYPGNGKTELANVFAHNIWADIKRIQGTNDLLPQDIIWYIWADGNFKKWPIFCNILVVDEINRIPAKSLSWLVSAMAEKVIINDKWEKLKLPDFFMVIATQNPNDNSGIYELPEAIKDRFWVKVFIDKEIGLLKEVYLMKQWLKKGENDDIISDKILDNIEYIFDQLDPRFTNIDLIKQNIQVWPSIRSWLQYIEFIKTSAYLDGRQLVTVEDLFWDIQAVFRDKLQLNPDIHGDKTKIDEILEDFVNIIRKKINKK